MTAATNHQRVPATDPATMPGRSTTGWWTFGATSILVHRHEPEGPIRGVVVVLPPPSNEALTTHRTERTLAARLVARGYAVVRAGFTGVSSSAVTEPDGLCVVERWEQEAADILRHARELYGAEAVTVVSTRLGATIALNAARHDGVHVDRAVLLAPVGSGRQYLRAMGQLLAIAAQSNGLAQPFTEEPDGSVPTYGMTLDAASAAHLRGYTIGDAVPGVDVHVVAGKDKPIDKTVRGLVAQDGVTRHETGGLGPVLDRISSYALVPTALLDEVVRIVDDGRAPVELAAPPADPTTATVATTPREVECEVVDVAGMPGLVTRPVKTAEHVLVWSPGATEPHDGPAGLWAQAAVRLALHGVATVRFDLVDSGERTRPDKRVDVYPYEDERVREVVDAVRWAADRFGLTPDLGGLCAGAWLAVAAAAHVPVRRLVPVNIEQWTGTPSIIERIDADPETGLPRKAGEPAGDGTSPVAGTPADVPVEPGVAEADPARLPAHPAPSGAGTIGERVRGLRSTAVAQARVLLKDRSPYRVRLELGRRRVIQAPEPFLDSATAHGATLRALLTQRDFAVLTALHGYTALGRLNAAGRDIVMEVDSATDHGMVIAYTRERVVSFLVRALVGEDIFY